MRRFFFSSFVIVTFILYVLHQKTEGVEEGIAIAPRTTPGPLPTIPDIGNPPATLSLSLTTPKVSSGYHDGTYTGDVADAFYGNIQVQTTIAVGKIADVKFLQYPNDRRTSIFINTQAMPILKTEAIQSQNANVDIVTGATQTSEAFIQSLKSALDKTK